MDGLSDKYKVYIGESSVQFIKGEEQHFTLDELEDLFAYKESDGTKAYKVTITADVLPCLHKEDWEENYTYGSEPVSNFQYYIWATAVYRDQEVENFDPGSELTEADFEYQSVADSLDEEGEGIESVWEFVQDFLKYPVQSLIKLFLGYVRMKADAIQILADTISLKNRLRVTFERADAQSDFDEKIKVASGDDTASYRYHLTITDDFAEIMDEEPEMPIIYVDLYDLASGSNDIFSINFFNGENIISGKQNENPIWKVIRKMVSLIIHVVYYIVAALLITALILNSMKIVMGTLNPKEKKESKEALTRFFESIIMLVGSIFVMSLSVYAAGIFLEDVNPTNSSDSSLEQYPIRVYVGGDLDYSFSTNFTGYVRFVSQIKDVQEVNVMALFVLVYAILVRINLIAAIFMIVRMVAVMILAVWIAIKIAVYAFMQSDEAKLNYKKWMKVFIFLSLVQMVFAMLSRILLEYVR